MALAALLGASVAPARLPAAATWSGGDPSVPPGDDFYRYANGSWMDRTVIPDDRAGFSTATMLTQAADAKVHDLLEQAAAEAGEQPITAPGKAGAYYAAFMDGARAEALDGQPLRPALDAIRAAGSKEALARLMGLSNASFQGSFFELSVEPDSREPDRYALYLEQGGLGLPERTDYLEGSSAPLRAAYQAYAARLLGLLGWSEPQRTAGAVLALETKIAAASWTSADERDETKIYNPMSATELARAAPDFPWAAYFSAAGVNPTRVIVVERTAIPALAHLFATTPLADLKAWAAFHLADNAAPDLSSAFYDAWFDLHARRLQGAKAEPPRWRRAIAQVSGGGWKDLETSRGAMGDAVGRMYLARSFDSRSRSALRAMVSRLKTTLRGRIAASPWMSLQAKSEALRKVDAYRIEIGAPARGDTYEGLVIRRDDLYGDVERVTAYAWAHDRAKLGRRVDRALWTITPQTVNAYNDAPLAEVVFTAALLQPPAFDASEDPALAYGGLGAIIGHELTHSFDDVGRRFDHTGHVREWWTPGAMAGSG